MWVSLHTQVGFFPSTPQPYPTVGDGTFRLRSKLQVQTTLLTPPYTISPGVPPVLQLAVPKRDEDTKPPFFIFIYQNGKHIQL